MSDSLKNRTLTGMGWSFIENVFGTGGTFVVGIVLARILSPENFGVLGLTMVVVAVAMVFTDSGFSLALIRKKNIKEIDYQTLFSFSLLVSIACYALLFVGAPWLAWYFEQPVINPICRVVGLILIINSLAVVQKVIFVRAVNFKIQAVVTIVATVVGGFVGISMALLDWGVWSLVWQTLSRYFCQSLLFWVYSKWRPRFAFSRASFAEFFHFGYKLLIAGLLETIYKNVFYIVIGKAYSPKALGEYTRASMFSNMFSANLLSVVQKVSFPVLSIIQDDECRLRESYRKLIKMTMIISFGLMLGMAAVAKPMIVVLIGEKWLPAAPYLQILCLSEMLYPLHAINLNILNVKGRSNIYLKLEIIKKTIAIPSLIVGIYFSIDLMLWFGVMVSFVAYMLNARYSACLINYSMRMQIMDIMPSFLVSVFVASVMWSVTLLSINPALTLGIQVVLGLTLGIAIYERLNSEEYVEIKSLLLQIINRVRHVEQ